MADGGIHASVNLPSLGLCVFSLPISFLMIERIYILCLIIIIKSEVWSITHCLGLGHETMVCAVCLSIFLSLAQIMTRRLVDAKPLSEPMLQYCKFHPWEIVIYIHKLSVKKMHLNISPAGCRYFVSTSVCQHHMLNVSYWHVSCFSILHISI